jgi:rhodanese-related sulfurtransferase
MTTRIGYRQLIDEAMARIKTIGVDEATALLGNDDVIFVDLRDVRELDKTGIIPGAVHAPRGMLEFWVDPNSPYHRDVFSSGKRFVFYCAAGWRSALATDTVRRMGLESVCHIDGGFGAWKKAGAKTTPFPLTSKLKPKPKPKLEWLQQLRRLLRWCGARDVS